MEIIQREKEGQTLLILEGVLDLESLNSLKERLMDSMREQKGVIIDLQNVEAWSAAGIQLLWSAKKTAQARNQLFSMINASSSLIMTSNEIGAFNFL